VGLVGLGQRFVGMTGPGDATFREI
jgi:hypothetical protein